MAQWLRTFKIKDLFTDEDVEEEEAQKIGKIVAERLRKQPRVFLGETEDFAFRFEGIIDQDEFNDILDELYDVADSQRVWIE